MIQLSSPLPNTSPQIYQQLLDYPPLPPPPPFSCNTHCIGIGSQGSAHQATHTSIDMAVVEPGQGVYTCNCSCFCLLYAPPPHSSIHVCIQSPTHSLTSLFSAVHAHALPFVFTPAHLGVHIHLYLFYPCACVCAHLLWLYCHS